MTTDLFYNHLPERKESMSELLSRRQWFHAVPDDWTVFMTDVVNSTKAVKEGRDKEVNLAAAGVIIAAINLAGKNGIKLPFVFSGDGACILCPPAIAALMKGVLAAHRLRCREQFRLEIRLGCVQVKELLALGGTLSVLKKHTNDFFSIAIFLGNGLTIAERLLKETNAYHIEGDGIPELLDLSGLECRWDLIQPRASNAEVVCLIVVPLAGEQEVLQATLTEIDAIYGDFEARNPVHPSRLNLTLSGKQLLGEAKMKKGKNYLLHFLRIYTRTLMGKLFFSWNFRISGITYKKYLQQLSVATDTLKIDGGLKTMFTGTVDQRVKLVDWLSEQENAGNLFYGYFATPATIITCFVQRLNGDHFHFLDGYGGGYTRASYEVKTKWNNLASG